MNLLNPAGWEDDIIDWDVATIIEALEELYPLQAEHKHLDFGSRWQQVVDRFRQ